MKYLYQLSYINYKIKENIIVFSSATASVTQKCNAVIIYLLINKLKIITILLNNVVSEFLFKNFS